MTEFVAWGVFPTVMIVLGLGCGLLVERASGRLLPGAVLLPTGFALMAVIADLLTRASVTVPVAVPFVVVVALAGLALSPSRVRGFRLRPWATAAALLPFVALLAAVLSTRTATFTGYTFLDDATVHFSLLEQVFSAGHAEVPGASSYARTVNGYLGTNYPLGSYLPLGVGWQLVGGEVAWLFQPWLGLLLASVSLSVYSALQRVGFSDWQRALVATATPQAGLFFAYGLQGSVKELATLATLALVVALGSTLVEEPPITARATAPLAVATAGGLTVLSLAVLPWIGVPLVAVALLAARRTRRSQRARTAMVLGAGASLVALLAAPALAGSVRFTRVATSVLQNRDDLGNLARPLDPFQLAGVWPNGDFRLALFQDKALVYVLIALTLLAAALGTIWLIHRRKIDGPILLAFSGAVAVPYLLQRGSAYADGKTLAIGSALVAMLALLGAIALLSQRHRLLQGTGGLLAGAVISGILWTNAIAYHDAKMAPKERFSELLGLDDRLAGRGPTLFAEYEDYTGYLLRRAEGVFVHRYVDRTTAAREQAKQAHDLDRMDLRYVTSYPLIVQRRSPVASRPPSGYVLEWSGHYYEAWRRTGTGRRIVTHEPGGNTIGGEPQLSCRRIEALALRASRTGAELRYAERPAVTLFAPSRAPVRPPWPPDHSDPAALHPAGPGLLRGRIRVPISGRYRLWLGGTFGRGFRVRLDGRPVGQVRYELGWLGQFFDLTTRWVPAGIHSIELERPGGDLRGGNGYQGGLLSYFVLALDQRHRSVRSVSPRRARRLCSRSLDWIEIVRR